MSAISAEMRCSTRLVAGFTLIEMAIAVFIIAMLVDS